MFVGRESEFQEISNHISGALKNCSPLSIYISGVPGTGKTAVTTAVIQKLQKEAKKSFKVILQINFL